MPPEIQIPGEIKGRTAPGMGELFVALAAGIAGSYVQMRRKQAGLLPGVAIGVSLVPPLAAAGCLLYFGNRDLVGGAILLFVTNLACIVLASIVVFFLLGMRPAKRDRATTARVTAATIVTLVVVALIGAHLGQRTVKMFANAREKQQVLKALNTWSGTHAFEVVELSVIGDTVRIDGYFEVSGERAREAVGLHTLLPEELSRTRLAGMVRDALGRPVTLEFSSLVRFVDRVPPDG